MPIVDESHIRCFDRVTPGSTEAWITWFAVIVLIAVFFPRSDVAGQVENIPAILEPDADSIANERSMGTEVIKLLRSDLFYEWPGPQSLLDKDYKLGIRGGGAYYSFSTKSHSYNRDPEIEFADTRLIAAPPYGVGFFVRLEGRDLSLVERQTAEAQTVLSYPLPKFLTDLPELSRVLSGQDGIKYGPLSLKSWVRPSAGDTYLYRVASMEKADVTVAFKVLKLTKGGAITIAWKHIASLPKPFVLYEPDDELRKRIQDIRIKENIASGEFVVKDNILEFVGPWTEGNDRLRDSLTLNGVRLRYKGY